MSLNAKIVHITCTPLAGAPIRLVQALNNYTDTRNRLINLNSKAYGARTFPEDLIWEDNYEECLEAIQTADILHFHHHWFDTESTNNPFHVNFKNEAQKNCRFIYQHHSAPKDLSIQYDTAKPALVIPHCPERYYPSARVVPNIIDLQIPKLSDEDHNDPAIKLIFAPSRATKNAWVERWETKASPETINILKQLSKSENGIHWEVICNTPYNECIKKKSLADIILEETVTGSYHQGALEGIALGKSVICHLDQRSEYILLNLTGAQNIPFINCKLERLYDQLKHLHDKDSLRELGLKSRLWYENHYAPPSLVKFYIDSYEDLLFSVNKFQEKTMQMRKRDFESSMGGLLLKQSEISWDARRKKHAPVFQKIIYQLTRYDLKKLKAFFRIFKNWIKNNS